MNKSIYWNSLFNRNSRIIKTSDRSTSLLVNYRRKKLEEFFELMDSDRDGYISKNDIDLESLPTEVLTILGSVI
jgi:Ca2+-binding EF-hand superfamily protein